MKINPKPRLYKQLRDLMPGDLFRRPDFETIYMKLDKRSDYPFNIVNILNGYPDCERETTKVILVEGEFTEK